MPEISIIIPVFNEAEIIQSALHSLKNNPNIELIIVDGGSQDKTVEFCQELGVKVIKSPLKGRANQMNFGANLATGNILLFLHIDTQLPTEYEAIIQEILSNPQTIAGAFRLKIDDNKLSLKFIEMMVNWRSQLLSLPYGDQAIFIKTSIFKEMGGFSNLPIMEDFEFIQRLKKRGKITISTAAVLTSNRRWQKLGILRTTLINQLIIIGYYLKIPPEKLANFYRN